MKGYMGKLLRINLSNNSILEVELNEGTLKSYVGGRGLGAKMLLDEVKPRTPPLSPQNKLMILTGPLTATGAYVSGGCGIMTKSPLTGIYNCTFMRGHFPIELKSTGYDGVIVEGKAEQPVFLWIDDDHVEFRKADYLQGMLTDDTEKYIREEIRDPKSQVMCIGPAGENLVKISCIIADKRACGRGGAGAVMGSKNLKALAVRGSRKVEVAHEELLKEENKKAVKKAIEKCQGYSKIGSSQLVSTMNGLGILPTRNFQSGVFEKAQDISGDVLNQGFVVKRKPCPTCPIGCTRVALVRQGPYGGALSEGPEYETIWAFGPQCGVGSMEAIIAADMLCDKLGLDTISAGNAIGFAMELFEKGIVKQKETIDQLAFGNCEAMITLLQKIAYRQGFGNVLSEGVKVAAEKIGMGAERYAMHVKGLELPGFDPRGVKGMGLNYATACRGGCHNRGWTIAAESFGSMNRFDTGGKAELVKRLQDAMALKDSTILCAFGTVAIGLGDISEFLYASTGWRYDEKELIMIGERISNVERLFNVREGIRRNDDTLPQRLLNDPMPAGPSKGNVVELEPMLSEYYRIRGWDEQGIPQPSKLKELGLGESEWIGLA